MKKKIATGGAVLVALFGATDSQAQTVTPTPTLTPTFTGSPTPTPVYSVVSASTLSWPDRSSLLVVWNSALGSGSGTGANFVAQVRACRAFEAEEFWQLLDANADSKVLLKNGTPVGVVLIPTLGTWSHARGMVRVVPVVSQVLLGDDTAKAWGYLLLEACRYLNGQGYSGIIGISWYRWPDNMSPWTKSLSAAGVVERTFGIDPVTGDPKRWFYEWNFVDAIPELVAQNVETLVGG